MKKDTFNLGFYFLLLTAFLVTFSYCKSDEEITRADFIGTYQIAEVCNGVAENYVLTIAAATGSENDIMITNLWNWEEQISATVSGDVITIPTQIADDVTFLGTGDLSGNTLTISFTARDGGVDEICVASGEKQ